MKKQKDKLKSGSQLIGLAILTTLVFLILRWTGVIDWRWVWIFAPLWGILGFNLLKGVIEDIIYEIKSWIDINRIR